MYSSVNSIGVNNLRNLLLFLISGSSITTTVFLVIIFQQTGNIHRQATKKESAILTEFSKKQDRIDNMSSKQFLLEEFNKSLNFVKIQEIKASAKKAKFPCIFIPDHQLDNITNANIKLNKVNKNKRNRKSKKKKDKLSLKTIPPQRTCAIVGSGGILLGSRCGAEIDAHDFVMRANLAAINEYQEDVGTKTNVMTINNEAARTLFMCIRGNMTSCDPKYRRFHEFKSAVLWFAKFPWMRTEVYSTFVNFFRKGNLDILVSYPFQESTKKLKRFWKLSKGPSSGIFQYSAAIRLCDMISIYGFYPYDKSPDGRNITYHYYSKIDSFENGHNMPEEFLKFVNMSKDGYFRLVTNKCVDKKLTVEVHTKPGSRFLIYIGTSDLVKTDIIFLFI